MSQASSKQTEAPSTAAEAPSTAAEAPKTRRVPAFSKPTQTRTARRRREVIAELVADLGRQPDAAERHLISTIADLTTQREAMASAQLRGAAIDPMVLLKIAGLITRTISALRGKAGAKARGPAGVTLADYLQRKAAEKASSATASDAA